MYRRTSNELSGEYFGCPVTSSGMYDFKIAQIWFIVKFYRIEMAVFPLHNNSIFTGIRKNKYLTMSGMISRSRPMLKAFG